MSQRTLKQIILRNLTLTFHSHFPEANLENCTHHMLIEGQITELTLYTVLEDVY